MRALVQRVRRAQVEVGSAVVGSIGPGLVVYLGVGRSDTHAHARRLAEKVAGLRIFEDESDKLNRSVRDVNGGVLAIANFTLMADARKGRRPAFVDAAAPDQAEPLYGAFVQALVELCSQVATGKFRTHMIIRSEADGPVNIVLDVPDRLGESDVT